MDLEQYLLSGQGVAGAQAAQNARVPLSVQQQALASLPTPANPYATEQHGNVTVTRGRNKGEQQAERQRLTDAKLKGNEIERNKVAGELSAGVTGGHVMTPGLGASGIAAPSFAQTAPGGAPGTVAPGVGAAGVTANPLKPAPVGPGRIAGGGSRIKPGSPLRGIMTGGTSRAPRRINMGSY